MRQGSEIEGDSTTAEASKVSICDGTRRNQRLERLQQTTTVDEEEIENRFCIVEKKPLEECSATFSREVFAALVAGECAECRGKAT